MDKIFNLKNQFFFSWYLLIVYYFILRAIFGIEYFVIYAFATFLVIIRIGFEKIALIFFAISMMAYILATPTEANHYMSFVFGFLLLSLLKNLYFIFIDNKTIKRKLK